MITNTILKQVDSSKHYLYLFKSVDLVRIDYTLQFNKLNLLTNVYSPDGDEIYVIRYDDNGNVIYYKDHKGNWWDINVCSYPFCIEPDFSILECEYFKETVERKFGEEITYIDYDYILVDFEIKVNRPFSQNTEYVALCVVKEGDVKRFNYQNYTIIEGVSRIKLGFMEQEVPIKYIVGE